MSAEECLISSSQCKSLTMRQPGKKFEMKVVKVQTGLNNECERDGTLVHSQLKILRNTFISHSEEAGLVKSGFF